MPGWCRSLAAILVAAAVFIAWAARADDSSGKPSSAPAELLPRRAIVPLDFVTRHFTDVKEAGADLNDTVVGNATGSISVFFTDAGGTRKITLSVDRYASADDAAAAFQAAVRASEAAPGFKLTAAPALGQEAFAGSSQVGEEMHYGLGARDGTLIVSATHAGAIPVTPENSGRMVDIAAAVLAAAKQALGP
jgi:hypothetical protein